MFNLFAIANHTPQGWAKVYSFSADRLPMT
jgi:hypothetical protein